MCLLGIMGASLSAKAQEIVIELSLGWNWISYPNAEVMDVTTAMDGFTPMSGDIINSQYGTTTYTGGRWRGGLTHFIPGWGYMYYSNREEPVDLVWGTPIVLPTVTTSSATNITTYGLTCGGEVTDSGNSGVLVRGVCWSTQQNPTVNDPHTTDGYGMGSFTSAVEGLEMSTTYYVRAYAMTTSGIGYGEQIMLSTKNGVPVLTTSAASEIGTTWATCGGDISDDGGIEVTERGICWSTSPNPTIEGNHGSNGAGLGSFSVNMNNLEPNTTYYVRAYATNSHTTAYGNEVFFRTEVAQTWQNGILPGEFSVSATRKAKFSQGNLQYQASTDSWRFASDQWEYVGTGNANISATYDGYIDLFGWGTSGWDNGNIYYHPYDYEYLTDWNAGDFGYGYGPTDGNSYNFGLTGDYANADWGVYNAILNGGNQPNQWRTLTNSEWNYVLNTRMTTSGIRYAKAQVYGVNGLVLVPDDWNTSIYTLNYTNRSDAPFNTNVIADADWATMENNGVVFLPAAGLRQYGTSVYSGSGYYWSANSSGNTYAYYRTFSNSTVSSSYYEKGTGLSVRLVSVTLPEVSTGDVNTSGSLAIIGGNITDDGNTDITVCGICCSTTHNPTTDDIMALAQNTTTGEFTARLNGLTPNTTYYARAFAINSVGTVYGNQISFTILPVDDYTVDLGLPSGTLWATYNVGATSPEDYGDYFAWGETQPKDFYNWNTYQYCNGSNSTLTKYCSNSSCGYNGFTDNLTTLLPEDDAATANWGTGWRMPTQAEWQELLDNTTQTWTTQNGVNGRLFTAANGNSLFLPAAGYRSNSSLNYASSRGYYWSSSLFSDNPNGAWHFWFVSDGYYMSYDSRGSGRSVRPVRSAQN